MTTHRDQDVSPETSSARRPTLSRERIVRAALDIVDRDGLDALSMRRLGTELGVYPMAVYYYLPNKDALLDAIVEALIIEIDNLDDDVSAPIEERVLALSRKARDVFLAHANALPVMLARRPPTAAVLRHTERLVRLFQEAGLTHEQAVDGTVMLTAAVRGIVAYGASDPTRLRPGDPSAWKEKYRSEEVRELHDKILDDRDASARLGAGFDFGIRALFRGLVASAPDAPGG